MFWKISWHNFKRKPLRSFLTLLGIAVGVASLLAVISGITTTNHFVDQQTQKSLGKSDLIIRSTDGTFSDQVLNEVKKVSGVQQALGLVQQSARIHLPGKEKAGLAARSVQLIGLSRMDSSLLPFKVIKGNPNASGLFLSKTTARLWEVKLGDLVHLEIDGKEHDVPVVAMFEDAMFLDGPNSWKSAERNHWRALLPKDTLEKMSEQKGELEVVRVQVVASEKRQRVQQALEERMKQQNESVYTEVAVADPRQNNRLYELYLLLLGLGGTGLIISCMILFQTVYTNITEREREFAAMKALGSTPEQIQGIVLREVLILSGMGTLFGTLLGILLADLLQKGIMNAFHIPLDYQLQLGTALWISVTLGILLPLLASVLPVRRASRISVTDALRNRRTDLRHRFSKRRIWMGLILLVISLFDFTLSSFVSAILGAYFLIPVAFCMILHLMCLCFKHRVEYEMALRNALRQSQRFSNMAAILMLGIALSLFMSSVINYQEKYLERDVTAVFGGHMQIWAERFFTEEDMKVLREKKGIKNVTQVKEAPVVWQSKKGLRQMSVLGVDPKWHQSHPLFTLQRVERKTPHLNAKGTILLGDYAFYEWGGKVGEKIRLQTPSGEKAFKVTGVVNTGFDSGYVGFVGRDRMKEEFGITYASRGMVTLERNQDPKAMKEALYRDEGKQLMQINTVNEEVDWQRRAYPGISLLFAGLLAVAMGMTGIGIVNLLIMSVTERIQDYESMRAIGVGRFQIYGMVIGEGAVIGVTGILVGSALGLWLIGLIALSDMENMEFFILWPQWLIICLCGAFVTLVASLIPAFRAGNVSLPPTRLE
ncbi:ABC transporter permease [Melghirimyces algeriensis]|uniref:Putative ABC transport system permease protein n=1 Tax=Melghirimyces algeriensis TaxID=910412 RepID=A0A521FED2_9BACL|nr:ABC transporter permease [Melghirimyces algeriensis]SMO94562.1 putative ABC transport system permease protein [Melghirimyces algeriensis]